MTTATPLPAYLVRRYHAWKSTDYAENQAWFRRLADEGQHPRAMVISCCDSRVHVTSIFGAETGEFFIHRNIANLVPPYAPDGDHHGTSAAVEFAVSSLKVAHIVVLGHSSCGGVNGCIQMCSGEAPELEKSTSFVGRWMEMLRPACEATAHITDKDERQKVLEKQSVLVSLENLMTFPFVSEAVHEGQLSLHGLWTEIRSGGLEMYDPAHRAFVQV
ncbi:carbonic anhydrase [Nioella nitratireducens]|uniref:carbonic anhydrase n=1 Tax=Nioella nitratireducens TaxID=1287720 RepID=UPI0008FCFB10|nr:carbonic anhydrase [Nioella nitratireducens]